MDKFDRIFRLHSILNGRRTVIRPEDLMAQFECSKPTLYRAIATLKDTLNAPVLFDKERGGFRYASNDRRYELPGLWFTAAELQALTVLQRLFKDLGGGLLEEHLGPLTKRFEALSLHRRLNLGEAASRLRFAAIAARPVGARVLPTDSAETQRFTP
jgi:predicted DNA-binding transcriptional regulator YafY